MRLGLESKENGRSLTMRRAPLASTPEGIRAEFLAKNTRVNDFLLVPTFLRFLTLAVSTASLRKAIRKSASVTRTHNADNLEGLHEGTSTPSPWTVPLLQESINLLCVVD